MVALCSFYRFPSGTICAKLLARANVPVTLRTISVILATRFFNRFRKRTSSQIETKFRYDLSRNPMLITYNLIDESLKSFFSDRLFQLTFPNNNYIPSLQTEQIVISYISLHISGYFGNPIILIRRRPHKSRAIMLMPETTVYKNYGFVFRQNNVWTTRKLSNIFSIPKSFGK